MEFDDYKIEPTIYKEMAKAYHQSLSSSDFRFVKINTNITEKQKILNDISQNYSKLFSHIEYLKKTNKARTHSKELYRILQKISLCKQICSFSYIAPPAFSKTNLCQTLKDIIDVSAEIIALCNMLSSFSKAEIDDKICNSTEHLLDIIKDTVKLFGECHYRY